MSGSPHRHPPAGPRPPRRRVGAGVHPAVLGRRVSARQARRSRLHRARAGRHRPRHRRPVVLWGGGQGVLAVLDDHLGSVPDQRRLPADSVVLDRHGAVIAVLHAPGERRVPVVPRADRPGAARRHRGGRGPQLLARGGDRHSPARRRRLDRRWSTAARCRGRARSPSSSPRSSTSAARAAHGGDEAARDLHRPPPRPHAEPGAGSSRSTSTTSATATGRGGAGGGAHLLRHPRGAARPRPGGAPRRPAEQPRAARPLPTIRGGAGASAGRCSRRWSTPAPRPRGRRARRSPSRWRSPAATSATSTSSRR